MYRIVAAAIGVPVAVALLSWSGAAVAQQAPAAAQTTTPHSTVKTPVLPGLPAKQASDTELEGIKKIQAQIAREHTDTSGRVRPDLRAAGIAHMRRMKVVTQIGPVAPAAKDNDE